MYKLGAFTVSGQREGRAATITLQRNANNVKNTVAMDSYGDVPNMSAGEVAALLPGISVTVADDGPNKWDHGARNGGDPQTDQRTHPAITSLKKKKNHPRKKCFSLFSAKNIHRNHRRIPNRQN